MSETTQQPKYIQLADHLRELIHTGELKVGDRLPSYVEFYRRFGATTATVQRVCNILEKEQLIERRLGSGVYVAQPSQETTGNIGLIASLAFQAPKSPYHVRLMGALTQAVASSGQHLLYLGTKDSWDPNACHKVDGVLLVSDDPVPVVEQLPPNFPVVSLLAVEENMTCVGIDEYHAGRLAARHLVEKGHRRIACLMERELHDCRRRLAGISDVLLEAGIQAEANWMRLTDNVCDPDILQKIAQPYRKWACDEMMDWLANGWQETGCTAIIVQNEVAAIGVVQTFQATGIQVPEQVSVITFDGTEVCDLITPHISAVAIPLEQIGIKAVEVLTQQIQNARYEPQTLTLPLHLRLGDSVRTIGPQQKHAEKMLVGYG